MSLTYAARVLEVDDAGPIVRVPMLGGGAPWGPLASSVPDLEVDDQVLVTPVGEAADRLHVIARLHARQTRQSEVPGLVARLEAIEALNATQDGRLGGIDTLNGQQNGRLTAVEGRAGTLETAVGSNTSRIGAVESVNGTQNGRLTATETVANGAQTAVTALDSAAVHRTGAETVGGVKTFTDQLVVPAPTTSAAPVRSDDSRLRNGVCRVWLRADHATVNNASDKWAGPEWTVGFDPLGWSAVDVTTGNFASLVVPWDGWYDVNLRIQYGVSTHVTPLVPFVAKNSRASTSTIVRFPGRFNTEGPNDGTVVVARESVQLAAGDRLYWGTYETTAVTLVAVRFANNRSQLTVRYEGPSPVAA